MDTLAGRVAVVTGAGQGIGRGVALALASHGVVVAALGRTEEKLKETCREVEARGGRALPVVCDVASAEEVVAAVGSVVAELGAVDILVNNAQTFGFGTVLELDLDELESGWTSGFLGSLRMIRACHPYLVGGGVVVNVGSGVVHNPVPGVAGYAAVKAAITSLSRSAAIELAGDGIRVNTIVPFALTPSVLAVFEASPEHREAALATVPLGRVGDPEDDIGRAVAFLCGPDARFVTGTVLTLDGGETHLR